MITKRFRNRKIARKAHGHTLGRGTPWQTNFEEIFLDADDSVPRLVEFFRSLHHPLSNVRTFARATIELTRKGRKLRNFGFFATMPEGIERAFLNLAASLFVRSPSSRDAWEVFPKRFGLPANEEVGKANMLNQYRAIKQAVLNEARPRKAYVVLRSTTKEFHCGDGYLGAINADARWSWKGLFPLTPDLCIYFFSPPMISCNKSIFVTTALDYQIKRINEITQIYSKDHVFFRWQKPQVTEEYRCSQFRMLKYHSDPVLDEFEEVFTTRSRSFSLTN